MHTWANVLRNALASYLLLLFALKVVSITSAVIWFRRHGREYARDALTDPRQPPIFSHDLLDRHGARGAVPFGIKDYRLRRFVEPPGTPVKTAIRLWHRVFYQVQRLILMSGLLLVIYSVINHAERLSPLVWPLVYSSHIILLLMAVESIVSYVTLGSYAKGFHRLSPNIGLFGFGSQWLQEMRIVVAGLMLNIYSGAVAVFVLYNSSSSTYAGMLNPGVNGVWAKLHVLLQALYFSVTTATTVGFGDLHPMSLASQMSTMLVEIDSFLYVAVVLAALGASMQRHESETTEDRLFR